MSQSAGRPESFLEPVHAHFKTFEACLHRVESTVHCVESLVDSVESGIHPIEVLLDSIESLVQTKGEYEKIFLDDRLVPGRVEVESSGPLEWIWNVGHVCPNQ